MFVKELTYEKEFVFLVRLFILLIIVSCEKDVKEGIVYNCR